MTTQDVRQPMMSGGAVGRFAIGVVGGTGPHGRGLARRFALAGHRVILGSREADRASAVAGRLRYALPPGCEAVVSGAGNRQVAADADVILLAVPWDPSGAVIAELAGLLRDKIVISCMNPLGFDASGAYQLETGHGSAAEHAATLLPGSRVVAAFHHLAAPTLLDPKGDLSDEDILVCGDDRDAKAVVLDMCVALTGRFGIDAGPLRVARYIEPFTAVLISINKRYRTQSGLAIPHVATASAGPKGKGVDDR
jgi:8-hydroxy-5-deazaflavin:NADPH oxidoreductase